MSTQPMPLNSGPNVGSGEAQQNPQPGFFSKIGHAIKTFAPYIAPIANRLAATFGNGASLEAEYRDKEMALRQGHEQMAQQLNQLQLENANLNRQLLQKQVENYRTPEQTAAAALTQAGALEDVKNLHAAGKDTTTAGGGIVEDVYDPTTKQRVTRPKMMTTQAPNPALAPYAPGAPKPDLVTDWNAGPPPTMPKTVPHEEQIHAQPLGVSYSPAGIDMDPNSPTYGQSIQYVRDKTGNIVKTIAAPAGRGTLDSFAPMVTNAERSVTQPTGEITKENFTTTRRRMLNGGGQGGGAAAPSGSGAAGAASGNLGSGKVIGGKAPTPVTQAFANVQDARNRLQVMQRDLEQINANPNGNTGSADMDLLSQHVALTFGTVKNARGGEQLIMKHIEARSLPEELQVMYQHLKSGGVLSPEQRQNFIHLAQSRLQAYQDQYANAQKEAKGGFGMGNTPPTMPPTGVPAGGIKIIRDASGRIIGIQ